MKFQNLNILRAVSIVCIIIGHVCLQMSYEPLGRFCGYLFVQIFFLVSAFLLGLKYGDLPLDMGFLIKRWKRLSVVYYPFLMVSMGVMMLIGETVTVRNVVTHFLYINYFVQDSMCGVTFGHLWYISMMMLCYVFVTVVCSLSKTSFTGRIIDRCTHGVGLAITGAITLAVCFVCMKIHVPCRIPIVLASYFVLFKRAKDVYTRMEKWEGKNIINVLFVISNAVCLILFLYWNLNDRMLPRDMIVLITACCWLLFFMISLKDVSCGKAIGFISAISFELYLVHHPFILGDLSWISYKFPFGNIWLNGASALFVIMILAYCLNKLGQVALNTFKK